MLTIGHNDLFYKSIRFERIDGIAVFVREYGPLHTLFYAYIIGCFLLAAAIIIYCYCKKRQVSRKTLFLLFLPVVTAMLTFFVLRKQMAI